VPAAIPPWLAAGASFAAAGVAVAVLLRIAGRLPHDRPGPRSLHARPVPRVGGVAIWTGVVVAVGLAPPTLPGPAAWTLALLAVTAVSALDDWRGLRPGVRLAVQALAAAVVALAILRPDGAAATAPPFAAIAGAVVAIAWGANLYNFMDGSDGVAAAMAVCGFGALAVGERLAGAAGTLPLAVAAATLPFLLANAPPARMFMGDVGSVPLGFLAAALGLAGWQAGHWPGWFPVLVFLPFVADATATLGRRLLRGERVWEPHRSHYYQRLHRLGAGHRGTLAVYGALGAATSAAAVATLAVAPAAGWTVLAGGIAVVGAIFAAIDYHWRLRGTDQR
jgi:UDP-N-acetylmuramyl pentapeptide phosphotransferase/UDP-N-acetylglucosamine-1-phosphate transferase